MALISLATLPMRGSASSSSLSRVPLAAVPSASSRTTVSDCCTCSRERSASPFASCSVVRAVSIASAMLVALPERCAERSCSSAERRACSATRRSTSATRAETSAIWIHNASASPASRRSAACGSFAPLLDEPPNPYCRASLWGKAERPINGYPGGPKVSPDRMMSTVRSSGESGRKQASKLR